MAGKGIGIPISDMQQLWKSNTLSLSNKMARLRFFLSSFGGKSRRNWDSKVKARSPVGE